MIIVKYFVSYLLTAVIFFALDIVWLGFVAKNIYGKYLGHFLKSQFNRGAGSYCGGARLGAALALPDVNGIMTPFLVWLAKRFQRKGAAVIAP